MYNHDLVFTKLSEDILSFDGGPPLTNSDHSSERFDYARLSCPSPCENMKRNLCKDGFESIK